MAYAPFNGNSRRQPSSSEDGDSSDDGRSEALSLPAQNTEPYYANEEIAILHEIVSEAQTNIEAAKEPKPLPVAALFRAYDRILPKYGLDPDEDHHISAFIFRVGGERSDASLLERFQIVLERMGIEIEFGEGDSISAASVQLQTPSDQPGPQPQEVDKASVGDESAPISTSSRSVENHLPEDEPKAENRSIALPAGSLGLSSSLNRWRNAAAAQRQVPPLIPSGPFQPSSEHPRPLPTEPPVEDEPQETHQAPVRPLTSHTNHATYQEEEGQGEEDELRPLPQIPPRPTMLSVLDRWRLAASRHPPRKPVQPQLSRDPAPLPQGDVSKTRIGRPEEVGDKAQRYKQVETQTVFPPSALNRLDKLPESPEEQSSSRPYVSSKQQEEPGSSSRPTPEELPKTPHQQVRSHPAEDEREEARLLQLARRAREIFIASKTFNHWADRTARRLEREAVARRHMIRFRCFRSWCQGPATLSAEVDRLRATTAVQKLRRAVAQHEEQLRIAALAVSQTYRLRKVLGALERWTIHKAESETRLKVARRSRVKAAAEWLFGANEHKIVKDHATGQHKLELERKVVADWHRRADLGARRDEAAKKLGDRRISYAYLAHWWDQAALHQRSKAYHRETLLDRSRHFFEQWNLQARRQAFIWRNEYDAVRKAFDIWERSAQEDQRLKVRAEQQYEQRLKTRYSDALMVNTGAQQRQLGLLSYRANLYIRATRILRVFDQAVERNQARRWEEVKQRLAMRYQQVSATRKRRNFFRAFDAWRAAATADQEQSEQARQINVARESAIRDRTLPQWQEEAAYDERRYYEAQLYHTLPYLAFWGLWADDQDMMNIQALDMITTGKRVQFQKKWSIAALQHGGLAHTASMIAHRNQRDKRNRTLQYWRAHSDKGNAPDMSSPSRRLDRRAVSEGPKSVRRPTSMRKVILRPAPDIRRQSTGTFETPTRWTGQPFPMGSLFGTRPMPPVRETDEEKSASSNGDDDEEAANLPMKAPHSIRTKTIPLSSTTPRVPVPSHLEEEFRAHFPPAMPKRSGPRVRSEGQEEPFRASEPMGRATPSTKRWPGNTTGKSTNGLSSRPIASLVRVSRPANLSRSGTPGLSGSGPPGGSKSISRGSGLFTGRGATTKSKLSLSVGSNLP